MSHIDDCCEEESSDSCNEGFLESMQDWYDGAMRFIYNKYLDFWDWVGKKASR